MTISGRAPPRIALDAARIVAVAVTYVIAAKLGLRLATIGVTVTLVWPASGVAVGIVLIAPLLLAWLTRKLDRPSLARAAELAALSLSAALVSVLLFSGVLPDSATAPLSFVVYPLLLWAALRFGQRGATTGGLVASLIAIVWTARGLGPFARETLGASLVFLNSFIAVAILTSLTVAAVMSERRRAITTARQGETRLRAIMDRLPASVRPTEAELRITSSQGALLESLGARAQALVGTTVSQ